MCTGNHPFIPAENTAELRMYFDTPGGKALNVTNWRKPDPWTRGELKELATLISALWEANFSPLQSASVACNRMVVTDIGSEDSFQVDAPPDDDLTGGNVSPIMPGNVTITTKFGTGHTGRSYRGRSYFIGLCENQCNGDFAQAGLTDQITAAWTDLVGGVHDSALVADLVIVSYCADGVWRTNALVNSVTEITTEETLDSMRTRLAGRGV